MEEDLKSLVIEIISLILVLIIAIPICVSASSSYKESKAQLANASKTTIDISNKGDIKEVTVYSNSDKSIKINLLLKISKFSDEYLVSIDENTYELNKLEYVEDEEYRYYNLGIYDVLKRRKFDFNLKAKDKIYYDETITYSFVTEGVM